MSELENALVRAHASGPRMVEFEVVIGEVCEVDTEEIGV